MGDEGDAGIAGLDKGLVAASAFRTFNSPLNEQKVGACVCVCVNACAAPLLVLALRPYKLLNEEVEEQEEEEEACAGVQV